MLGIISGNLIDKQESESLYRYAEVEKPLLMLLTFVFYGAVMLYPALQQLNFTILIYALLTLTVVRMLSVAISLIGTKLRFESVLYLVWFGPVGIGSILYVYTILGVLLYTLLDCRPPDPGTVINLRGVRLDVHQSVEQVVLNAIARNPDERFQTPGEFKNALNTALSPVAPQPGRCVCVGGLIVTTMRKLC